MSFTNLRDKLVTTRKKHQCYGCLDRIPIGACARNIVSVESASGDLGHFYLCLHCSAFVEVKSEAWGDDPSEGVDWGFVNEYKRYTPYDVRAP